MATNKLTVKQVQNAKPGKIADGGGLWLYTKKTGSQSWFVRISTGGKRQEIGLGGAKDLSLKDARIKAAEYRQRDVVNDRVTFAQLPVPQKNVFFGSLEVLSALFRN